MSQIEPAQPLQPGSTIGILGGGQLARMLATAAARLGYETVVLDPSDPCPAAQVTNSQIVGAYDDSACLVELADRCDVVTYEFENVPEKSARLLSDAVALVPNVRALAISQDRLTEKDFLGSIGLPTARYEQANSQAEAEAAVSQHAGQRAILKARRLGYDGKGQLRVDGDLPSDAFDQLGGVPLVAEAFVDFVSEISVIVARTADGTTRCFEPARNEHDGGILVRSTVPCGQPDEVVAAAKTAAKTLVESLDYVGVLGLELFVLPDASLIVNEFAPRVHNSGHWTELACVTDQFEQHIRAVANLPLGDPSGRSCEMINLIGPDVDLVPDLLSAGGWRVHLYGKADVRPGRKMGHATRLL